MSDIVERLTANTHKYPGFQNLNTEAIAEITRLREQLRAEQLECLGELGKVQGLEIVNKELRARLAAWKAEAEAARRERAAFFSRTMNYEDWQAASKLVEDARAATDAIEKNAS